jgi:hypothetical protein
MSSLSWRRRRSARGPTRACFSRRNDSALSTSPRFTDREVHQLGGWDDTVQEAGVDRILWCVQPSPLQSFLDDRFG